MATSPQTTNKLYYLTCSVDLPSCPTENQAWVLVDPHAAPTPDRVAELSHQFFVAFFLPTLMICLLAWGVRQVIGAIR